MTRFIDLFHAEEPKLSRQAYCALLLPVGVGILGIAAIVLFLPLTAAVIVGILWTAAALCLSYYGYMTRLLPFLRTRRLYAGLSGDPEETVEGVCLGEKSAKNLRDGVLMRRLRIDAGDLIKGEPVEREADLPAVFDCTLPEGTNVRVTTVRSVVTELDPCGAGRIRLARGAYQPMRIVYVVLILAAAAIWLTGAYAVNKWRTPPKTDVAVCTLAYHAEYEAVLNKSAKEQGLSLAFAYSTSLDKDILYQYLATYGTHEAELLLLPASAYLSTFDTETPALPVLPEGMRTIDNANGAPVAVVLYDPDDAAYSARFASLIDWIAIPRDDMYVAAIGPQANETASSAFDLLLSVLLRNEF
jgi:hypothetical protein